MGFVYDREGNTELALSFYKKACDLNPDDSIAKKNKEITEKSSKEAKKDTYIVNPKVIDVEDGSLIIQISDDLKLIIQLGKDSIARKISDKFLFIDDIKYNWY